MRRGQILEKNERDSSFITQMTDKLHKGSYDEDITNASVL